MDNNTKQTGYNTQSQEPKKKADIIIEKLDCALGAENTLISAVDKTVQNTSYLSRQNSEIFERSLAENSEMKQQMKYIAQQTQVVYAKMTEFIDGLSKKIDDLQGTIDKMGERPSYTVDEIVNAVMERINNGQLADSVASRIDYDAINDGVEEVFAEYFAGEEVEEGGNVVVPEASAATVDYDLLSRKVADMVGHMPTQEAYTVDAVATRVAQELCDGALAMDYREIAECVVEKLREDDTYAGAIAERIDYNDLSNLIAQKIGIKVNADTDIDYDKLATLLAYKISPETADVEAIGERFAEETTEEEIYAELEAEELAEKRDEEFVEESPATEDYKTYYEDTDDYYDYEEDDVEDAIDYDKLAALIAEKIGTVPASAPANGSGDVYEQRETVRVEREFVQPEIDYEKIVDMLAERLQVVETTATYVEETTDGAAETSGASGETAVPVYGMDYERLSTLVADKLVEREDIVVDEFFDYNRLAELLVENMTTPIVETGVVAKDIEIDYDKLASEIADRLSAETTTEVAYKTEDASQTVAADIDYELLSELVAKRIELPKVEISEEIDYDKLSGMVAERIEMPAAESAPVEIDYERLSDMVAGRVEVPVADASQVATEVVSGIDYEKLSDMVVERMEVPTVNVSSEEISTLLAEKIVVPDINECIDFTIDYDELSSLIAERLVGEDYPGEDFSDSEIDAEYIDEEEAESEAVEEKIEDLDYEILSDVVETAVREAMATLEIDYGEVARGIVERINEMEDDFDDEADVPDEDLTAEAEGEPIDYARIGRIVHRGVYKGIEDSWKDQETVDYDELSSMIAQKVVDTIDAEDDSVDDEPVELEFVDYGKVADIVREVVGEIYEENKAPEPEPVDDKPIVARIAEEDISVISDEIARHVFELMPTDYETMVDEEGCDKIAKAVYERIDKEALAQKIVEYLRVGDDDADKGNETSYADAVNEIKDDIVQRIISVIENFQSENESRQNINKDEIVGRLSAALRDVEEEGDARLSESKEEIVRRIVSAIESRPEPTETETETVLEIDYEKIAGIIAEKISVQEESVTEYRMELDEASVDKISDIVIEEVKKYLDERQLGAEKIESKVDVVDDTTKEIRDMLERGIVLIDDNYAEIYDGQPVQRRERVVEERDAGDGEGEEETRESEEASESVPNETSRNEVTYYEEYEGEVISDDEQLITISDIIGDIEEEDTEAEPSQTPEEEQIQDVVIILDQNVRKARQHAAKNEGINSTTVEFGTMMRYNRSFISRIIQGSDDIKTFYGRIKTAFLAYRKVNSNLSWGGERFNKGRETIARLKIRGKTLVLYLALNPMEFKESIYHQIDASDIKSVANTPMMVKVKSPLGTKKAIRLIDNLLARRDGIKQSVRERDYVAMYPTETTEQLIEDGLIKRVTKGRGGD